MNIHLILDDKTTAMQKTGIPTDFSANAFNALRYAAELFKYEQCEFFYYIPMRKKSTV